MLLEVKFSARPEGGYAASHLDYLTGEWKPACAVLKTPEGWTTAAMLGDDPVEPQKTRKAAVRALLTRQWNRYAEALEEELPYERYYENYDRGEANRRMSPDLSNQIFDILVAECGAQESGRDSFLASMSMDVRDENYRSNEHRFGGWLGFGGKFWNERNRFRVSAYDEDTNPRTRLMMARANKKLQDLYQQTWPYTP